MSFSLKTLVRVTAVLLATVFTVITAVVNFLAIRQSTDEFGNNTMQSQLGDFAYIIEDTVNSMHRQIEIAASVESLHDESVPLEERKARLAAAAENSDLLDFSISDAQGKTYSDTDIHERDYFQNALNGTTYISSPVIRKTNNSLVVMAGAKLKNADGIIYGGIASEFFSSLIMKRVGYEGEFFFMLDKKGVIIAGPDEEVIRSLSTTEDLAKENPKYFTDINKIAPEMVSGSTGSAAGFIDGEKYHLVYKPLNIVEGWSLCVAIPENVIMSSSDATLRTNIIIVAAAVITSFIAAIFFANFIGNPVVIISRRIRQLACGELHAKFENHNSVAREYKELFTNSEDMLKLLTSYIGDIDHVLSALADKDFTVSSKIYYLGDFSKIRESLVTITEQFHEIFKTVTEVTQSVNSGAEQVAGTSDTLAQGTASQIRNIEKLKDDVANVSAGVSETSEASEAASEIAEEATEGAKIGNEKMHAMLESIADIAHTSDEIRKVTKTIEDIAFQTNILALNASVEAARAGEAGKGFAVVAGEVRNLAGKSAEAAKDTTKLIKNSIRAVNNGTSIANETAAALDGIVGKIDEMNRLMSSISGATKIQSSALSEITERIGKIGNRTSSNSAASEETASISAEFSNNANKLADIVESFKL